MTTKITHDNNTPDIWDIFWEEKVLFFLVFMGVITVTYGFLFVIDFLPEKPTHDASETKAAVVIDEPTFATPVPDSPTIAEQSAEIDADTEVLRTDTLRAASEPVRTEEVYTSSSADAPAATAALPLQIIFDSLDNRTVSVRNPQSTSIADLDHALLSGVVRHPDSANLMQDGTLFLFGHSSYLPNVINKNFQAFNGIQKLTWGDTVRLHSADMEYVYRVDRVYEVKASSADVAIEYGEAKLTLATCNSFGSKDDRYIVEATLVEKRALNADV